MLDEEELIEAVEARPQLYDKTDPKYSNREYTRLAWDEIALELNGDVEVLRKRWSSLRDYFMRQVRMEKRSVRRRKWPLFDAMGFLLPYVQLRDSPNGDNGFNNSESNNSNSMVCKNEPELASSASMHEAEQPIAELEEESEPTTFVYPMSRPFKNKQRKRLSETIVEDDSNFHFKSPKTSNLKNHEEEDDDFLFLRSLLPAMKNLSPLDRFEFRHEVQGLLLNYLRKEELLKRKSHQGEPE